jgi:hypothetical protein
VLLASDVPSEVELRALLEQRVIDDLLGPAGGPEEEIADGTVRDRYLVGMLAPRRLRVAPELVDRLEVEEATSAEEDDHEDTGLAAPTMLPSAMGLSFAVATGGPPLRATARWGNYRRLPSETLQTEKGNPKTVWKRRTIEETVTLPPLAEGAIGPIRVGGDSGDALAPAQLRGVAHRVGGVWVVSLFLVNVQDEPEERRDEAWLFQPELAVEAVDGSAVFCARMLDALPGASAEPREDERRMAMLYRNRCEIAVGHGVAVHADVCPDDPSRGTRLVTRAVPVYEVARQTAPTEEEEPQLRQVEHDMKRLAESSTPELVATLQALASTYSDWEGCAIRRRDWTVSSRMRRPRWMRATRRLHASALGLPSYRRTGRRETHFGLPTARCGSSGSTPSIQSEGVRDATPRSKRSTCPKTAAGGRSSSPSCS